MNASPLLLERHFFSKVHLDVHENGDPKVPNDLRCEMEVGQALENPKRFQVLLRLFLTSPADKVSAYTGEIHAVGLFRVDESWPEKKTDMLVQSNGSALLYSAIREMVSNLTARGPWPMVTLRTVTFIPKEPASDKEGKTSQAKLKPPKIAPASS